MRVNFALLAVIVLLVGLMQLYLGNIALGIMAVALSPLLFWLHLRRERERKELKRQIDAVDGGP